MFISLCFSSDSLYNIVIFHTDIRIITIMTWWVKHKTHIYYDMVTYTLDHEVEWKVILILYFTRHDHSECELQTHHLPWQFDTWKSLILQGNRATSWCGSRKRTRIDQNWNQRENLHEPWQCHTRCHRESPKRHHIFQWVIHNMSGGDTSCRDVGHQIGIRSASLDSIDPSSQHRHPPPPEVVPQNWTGC